jgi:hypothetical protein
VRRCWHEGKVQRHRLGELGLAAKTAVLVVEILAHLLQRLDQDVAPSSPPSAAPAMRAAQHGREPLGLAVHLIALVA